MKIYRLQKLEYETTKGQSKQIGLIRLTLLAAIT